MDALADGIEQNIANAENIQAKGIFLGLIVIIKIDPDVIARFLLHDQVVISNVAMFESVLVQEYNGLEGIQKLGQDFRDDIVKIFLMA